MAGIFPHFLAGQDRSLSHANNDLELGVAPTHPTVSPVSSSSEREGTVSALSENFYDASGSYPGSNSTLSRYQRPLTSMERRPCNLRCSVRLVQPQAQQQGGCPAPCVHLTPCRCEHCGEGAGNEAPEVHIVGSFPQEPEPAPAEPAPAVPAHCWHPVDPVIAVPRQPILRAVNVDPIAPVPQRVVVIPDEGAWVTAELDHPCVHAKPPEPEEPEEPENPENPDGTCLTNRSYNCLVKSIQLIQISFSISIFWIETLFLAVWITPFPGRESGPVKAMHAVAFLVGLFTPVYTALCWNPGRIESVRILLVDFILFGGWLALAVFAAIDLPVNAQTGDNRFYTACTVRLALLFLLSLAFFVGVCCRSVSLATPKTQASESEE